MQSPLCNSGCPGASVVVVFGVVLITFMSTRVSDAEPGTGRDGPRVNLQAPPEHQGSVPSEPPAGRARLALPLEDTDPIVHVQTVANGSGGSVSDTGFGTTVLFQNAPARYTIGPIWNQDPVPPCTKGGFMYGEEAVLFPAKPDGNEMVSYEVLWRVGLCRLFFGGVCDPVGCGGNCYDPASGPYHITTTVWDGPPSPEDPSFWYCGLPLGSPIPGTTCVFESTSTATSIGTCTLTSKVMIPDRIWITLNSDIDDTQLRAAGNAPSIGFDGFEVGFFGDLNADTCFDAWQCDDFNLAHVCADQPGFPDCDWGPILKVTANAQILFKLIPIPPPAESKHAATYSYVIRNGTEAVLTKGGEPVWFEARVTDFDPKQTGVRLLGYQVTLDAAGLSSGLLGSITPFQPACTDHPECRSQLGPGSGCSAKMDSGRCRNFFQDIFRTDYVYLGLDHIRASTGTSVLGIAFQNNAPGASLAEFYLGTVVFDVPADAAGTFTVNWFRKETALIKQDQNRIPLVGFQSAKVTVEVGRCCFGLDAANTKQGCIDILSENLCNTVGVCKGRCSHNAGIRCADDAECSPGGTCVLGPRTGLPCLGDAAVGETPAELECDPVMGERCIRQGATYFLPGASCSGDPALDCPRAGACCDRTTGTCTEKVAEDDCQGAQLEWTLYTACRDVACDEHTGACCDGTTGTCLDNVPESQCPVDPSDSGNQYRWAKGLLCSQLVPPCQEHTGACCTDEGCTDDVLQSACASEKWFKDAHCSDPAVFSECARQAAIPTLSVWGILVLTLCLLVARQIYFGRRRLCQRART